MPNIQSNLLGLVDSESEDGLDVLLGPKHTSRQPSGAMPATKKARGRPAAANKVTKPAQKTSARRTSGRLAAAIEQSEDRAALTEKSSNRQPKAPAKGRKGAAASKDAAPEDDAARETPPAGEAVRAKAARGRPKKAAQEESAEEDAEPARPVAKRGRKKAAPEREEVEIPETQQPDPEAELSSMELDLEESEQVEDLPMHDSPDVPLSSCPSSHVPFSATRRPAAGLPSFDAGDPTLRRRLGELTKKYETLEARYRDLRDVAVREAERNFDRLKKQSEERASTANQLIASLKAELAAQKELAKEGQKFKSQLETSESRVDSLQTKVTELTGSLSESKTEIKSLSMKLAASRTAEATAAARTPGSAIKAGNGVRPNEAIHQATQMQMKGDLYGDLTGLIVRAVKKEGGEDVFDCIQTGRNGSEYSYPYIFFYLIP